MKKLLSDMSKEEVRNYKEDLEDDYAENLESINFYSQALEDRSNIEESRDIAILLTKFVLHAHDILGTLEAVEMYE